MEARRGSFPTYTATKVPLESSCILASSQRPHTSNGRSNKADSSAQAATPFTHADRWSTVAALQSTPLADETSPAFPSVASSILRLHEPLVRIENTHRTHGAALAACRCCPATVPHHCSAAAWRCSIVSACVCPDRERRAYLPTAQ